MQTIKEKSFATFKNAVWYSLKYLHIVLLDMKIGLVLPISYTLIIHVAPITPYFATPGFMAL